MKNRRIHFNLNFWVYLIIFAVNIKPALDVSFNNFYWYGEMFFVVASVVGMGNHLFFPR